LFLVLNPVDDLDHLEDYKCQQDEVNRDGDEITIGEDRNPCFFEGIKCAGHVFWDSAKHNKKVGKVDSAPQKAGNYGHDNVIDQGINNFSKGAPNNDSDCKINHITTDCKGSKFFYHFGCQGLHLIFLWVRSFLTEIKWVFSFLP